MTIIKPKLTRKSLDIQMTKMRSLVKVMTILISRLTRKHVFHLIHLLYTAHTWSVQSRNHGHSDSSQHQVTVLVMASYESMTIEDFIDASFGLLQWVQQLKFMVGVRRSTRVEYCHDPNPRAKQQQQAKATSNPTWLVVLLYFHPRVAHSDFSMGGISHTMLVLKL